MIRRIRVQREPNGKSRLEGYDYAGYPKHNFFYMNDPKPVAPLWASVAGVDEWRKECFRRRVFSDTFAVEYVQQGIFVFQQNHVTMKVRPGEIFLVHLDRDNSMCCETDFAVKRTVIMRGPLLRPMLASLGLDRIDRIAPREHEEIDRCFDRICSAADGSVPRCTPRDYSIACYTLLLELAEQAVSRQRPRELQRVLEYMHAHLNEPLRMADLLRLSGWSSATLHRQFRRYMNDSPMDYFLGQKLERAKSLLENHPYSIKEVAEMLHYASPQYFASEFKKKYKVPPGRFKYRIAD